MRNLVVRNAKERVKKETEQKAVAANSWWNVAACDYEYDIRDQVYHFFLISYEVVNLEMTKNRRQERKSISLYDLERTRNGAYNPTDPEEALCMSFAMVMSDWPAKGALHEMPRQDFIKALNDHRSGGRSFTSTLMRGVEERWGSDTTKEQRLKWVLDDN